MTPEQVEQVDACFENFEGNPNPPKMLDNEDLQVAIATKKQSISLTPKQGNIKFALGCAFALAVAYVAGAIFKSRTASK